MFDFSAWVLGAVHLGMFLTFVSNLIYLRRQTPAPLPEPAPRLSVLIPARNEAANLRRLLPSLFEQSYENVEFIVYDDASRDETWDVLAAATDQRLIRLRGSGPPAGWIGKVHALYQATRHASGDYFLFLDADTELAGPDALHRIVSRFLGLPPRSVLTGLPRYGGGGLLLVSLVANAALAAIPWLAVRPLPFPSLGALNGQCWMISALNYRALEPHRHVAGEVLEDVYIGRYLKKNGIAPALVDLRDAVKVYMYNDPPGAWRGFRKNIYPLMGNNVPGFIALFLLYFAVFVAAPFISPWLLAGVYLNKLATDRTCGFPVRISLLAPLAYALGSILQVDSAWHNLTGAVYWKGRRVKSEE